MVYDLVLFHLFLAAMHYVTRSVCIELKWFIYIRFVFASLHASWILGPLQLFILKICCCHGNFSKKWPNKYLCTKSLGYPMLTIPATYYVSFYAQNVFLKTLYTDHKSLVVLVTSSICRDAARFHEAYSTLTASCAVVVIPHQDHPEVLRRRIQNTRGTFFRHPGHELSSS